MRLAEVNMAELDLQVLRSFSDRMAASYEAAQQYAYCPSSEPYRRLMQQAREAKRGLDACYDAAGVAPSDDAQRLDWLQGFADVRLEAWFADGKVTRRVTHNGYTIGSGRTLREAIDAARAACPRGPADAPGVVVDAQTQQEKP
jgi:hypothetical protein